MNSPKLFFIALGSNQGNRFGLLQEAMEEIERRIGDVSQVSSVYETPAWDFEGNAFLNACLAVKSRFSPQRVLEQLLQIETAMGRKRQAGVGYTSRPIDLDILLVENEVIDSENLQVPHPRMHERSFVMAPLADIASEIIHPGKKQSVNAIFDTLEKGSLQKISQNLKLPKKISFAGYNYIAVEGNIGAGKTSFSTMVSQDYNARLILERFKDNPFLPKFYEDSARFAFPLEMSFLADRHQQLADDLAQYDLFTEFVISDYDVFKSLIFAKITLQKEEFSLYQKLFHLMYKELVKPDLYVYLYQNTDRLLENIQKRGREYEKNIKAEYLANINQSYLSFIKSQPALNVRIVDISDLDFVNKREDYLHLLAKLIEN